MSDSFSTKIKKGIIYEHMLFKEIPQSNFHLHDGCEIYFFISGNVKFLSEKNVYSVDYGDLFITNPNELHKTNFLSSLPYERIILQFDPETLRNFSSDEYDLLRCFYDRPNGELNKLSLSSEQTDYLINIFNKIDNNKKTDTPDSFLLLTAGLLELLVFVNRLYYTRPSILKHDFIPAKLSPILDYIHKNLGGNLSLENLEKEFYINRFYLSKLFRIHMHSTLHEYIVYKRVSEAKKLLRKGCSIEDTASQCGFKDYCNFIRVFKKIVGIPPGKYSKRANSSMVT